MARSIRDPIHRLLDQKITLTHLPAQICTRHFLVLPYLEQSYGGTDAE